MKKTFNPLLPPPAKSQKERFIEAARTLGCDEDEAKFDEAMNQILKPKKEKPTA